MICLASLKKAYFIAGTGHPGPVSHRYSLRDIQTRKISMTEYNKLYEVPIHLEGYDPTYKGHQGQIKKQLPSSKMQSAHLSLLGQAY